MIYNTFTIILISIISLIPIIIWGYLFAYLNNDSFNRFRFLIGIFAGVISVGPVLFLSDIIEKTNFSFLNIFNFVYNFSGFGDIFMIIYSFGILLFLFSIIPFVLFYGVENYFEKVKRFLINFLVFFIGMIFFSFFIYFLNIISGKFNFLQNISDYGINFGEISFNSVKLVIYYYLIIGIIEEVSKFFCFKYSLKDFYKNSGDFVLYSVFVALGFAFFENILYLKNIYTQNGFGKDLVVVYFYRNIFSVFLHIICSATLSYFFAKGYIFLREKLFLGFGKKVLIGLIFGVFLHSIFDLFLTFNLTFIIFFYFIFGYFYLTYIFYSE